MRSARVRRGVRIVRALFLRKVEKSGRVYASAGVSLVVGPGGVLRLGDRVSLGRDVGMAVGPGASLTIGARTHLQPRVRINATHSVSIGADCAISWDVDILDSDFHQVLLRGRNSPPFHAPVIIEDHVWIGTGAKILKGVTIGTNSVIAAGAVVTRNVPAGSLWAGVPARAVKDIEGWLADP